MRPLGLFLVLILLASLVGCGPRWHVIKQAEPNPFGPSSAFHVAELTFQGLMVGEKTEATYLADKDPSQQASFAEDKRAMNATFMDGLSDARKSLKLTVPGAEAYGVQVNIEFIEPGYYAGVVSSATEVRADVKVFDAGRVLIDEFSISATRPATMTSASSGQRMRESAEQLGRVTAVYLRKRTGID